MRHLPTRSPNNHSPSPALCCTSSRHLYIPNGQRSERRQLANSTREHVPRWLIGPSLLRTHARCSAAPDGVRPCRPTTSHLCCALLHFGWTTPAATAACCWCARFECLTTHWCWFAILLCERIDEPCGINAGMQKSVSRSVNSVPAPALRRAPHGRSPPPDRKPSTSCCQRLRLTATSHQPARQWIAIMSLGPPAAQLTLPTHNLRLHPHTSAKGMRGIMRMGMVTRCCR